MLARLSIRDIVLIERLDIEFSRGLAVLTGETGAGKSILLDARLRWRSAAAATQVWFTAWSRAGYRDLDVPKGHPATKILAENGLECRRDDPACRVQLSDGAAPAPSSTIRRSACRP